MKSFLPENTDSAVDRYIKGIFTSKGLKDIPIGDGYSFMFFLTFCFSVACALLDTLAISGSLKSHIIYFVAHCVRGFFEPAIIGGFLSGVLLHIFVQCFGNTTSLEASIKLAWIFSLLLLIVVSLLNAISHLMGRGVFNANGYGTLGGWMVFGYIGLRRIHQMNRKQAVATMACNCLAIILVGMIFSVIFWRLKK